MRDSHIYIFKKGTWRILNGNLWDSCATSKTVSEIKLSHTQNLILGQSQEDFSVFSITFEWWVCTCRFYVLVIIRIYMTHNRLTLTNWEIPAKRAVTQLSLL